MEPTDPESVVDVVVGHPERPELETSEGPMLGLRHLVNRGIERLRSTFSGTIPGKRR